MPRHKFKDQKYNNRWRDMSRSLKETRNPISPLPRTSPRLTEGNRLEAILGPTKGKGQCTEGEANDPVTVRSE